MHIEMVDAFIVLALSLLGSSAYYLYSGFLMKKNYGRRLVSGEPLAQILTGAPEKPRIVFIFIVAVISGLIMGLLAGFMPEHITVEWLPAFFACAIVTGLISFVLFIVLSKSTSSKFLNKVS
ncbi:hypothetical protein [Holophaga foetida]|uniref:hypothetical protein n=1 Tax=Holophaga foetida TaxID=35839 RepID=UPI0002474CB1|nr:hypothetical protein [Holophaga foetida]